MNNAEQISLQVGALPHSTLVDQFITLDTEIRAAFRQRRHVGAVFF